MTFLSVAAHTEIMQCICLTLCLATASLLTHPVAVAQDAKPVSSNQAFATPKNNREWNRLCTRAKTAEEFRALSKWCDGQAGVCRRSQAAAEEQLRRPYPSNYARSHNLSNTIERCRKQVKQWSDLSWQYSSKAESLEAATIVK